MKRLEDKMAWVTGSSRGIGRVVAAHLASLGARVVEFFVTSDSSYVSGQVLRVDGGAQLFPA